MGRSGNVELVRELAAISSDYICCVARRTIRSIKIFKENNVPTIKFCVRCQDCHGGMRVTRTPVKSNPVTAEDVAPILKLIGHQVNDVRLSLVSLLKPVSTHSVLSPEAARLWVSCVTDEDQRVRQAFSDNISYMLR